MRRTLLLLTTLLLALSLAPAAGASLQRFMTADKDSLALRGGTGRIVVGGSGIIIGNIARGRIDVTDLPRGAATSIAVSGWEKRAKLNRRTWRYSGKALSYSVSGGTWRVRIAGAGLNASAVVKGTLILQGTAGRYSIDGAAYKKWPRAVRVFRLGG